MAKKSSRPSSSFPRQMSRKAVLGASRQVLARRKRPITRKEDIFRISVLGLDWDIGLMVYTPAGKITRGADGKKAGFFLLHGGSGDFKLMDPLASVLAERFGYKVVAMTFPGRLYLDHRSRDWPGDTLNPDGSARMPIWKKGERITPDQYRLVHDISMRARYGTRTLARAKPGTLFHHRMAAWPVAFEEAMLKACGRHFPEGEYSVYAHGHSTGGAFTAILSQRLANMAGQTEVETAPIGAINIHKHAWANARGNMKGVFRGAKASDTLADPFTDLYIRTWRDRARYAGPEALGKEGATALMRLPWLMEQVFEKWQAACQRPQFKAEFMVTHNVEPSLRAAARATARRLGLSRGDTRALVARYLGYGRYMEGPPVPPALFVNSRYSRDNTEEAFRKVIMPMLGALTPPVKTRLVMLDAAGHLYYEPDDGLPLGIAPVAAKLFDQAVRGGYFSSP